MANFSRNQRVSEQMRRELADLLMFEVKDPRVKNVTINEIEVTGDMAHAKVFYVAPNFSQELQKGLDKAAGFLRSQVAKRMMLRTVPQLHFTYDETMDNATKMSALIDTALASSPKTDAESDSE